MASTTKIAIDPSSRILYSSFYIDGLYKVFGKQNVTFSSKYFRALKRKEESHSHDHYMAFVVISDNNINRFVIDFRDKPSIKESAYNWCDKYAKINFNRELTDSRFYGKIISIPPGFGIRIWNFYETFFYCAVNFIRCKLSPIVSVKEYIADYYRQFKRPNLSKYTSPSAETNKGKPYIFMIATLWKNANCIEGTNLMRKTFMEVCKRSDCEFEGGFFSTPDHPQFSEFKHLIFTERYSSSDYLEKTKKSAIVFNTPAVHNCHGWKLGEFLAMGKAVISMPLSNELPAPLKHGKDAHYVSSPSDFLPAVERLLNDDRYRQTLEAGAKEYYDKYASPETVIKKLANV